MFLKFCTPLFLFWLGVCGLPLLDVELAETNARVRAGSNNSEPQLRAEAIEHDGKVVKLWPKGKIVYQIEDELKKDKERARKIHIACIAISDATCIKMVNRTESNSKEPWLIFKGKDANGKKNCYSLQIGFVKGEAQPATIIVSPDACQQNPGINYAGIVVHEILHALGFLHEFQRTDRDSYIDMSESSFNPPIINGNTQNLTFDFKSITMYDGLGFGFKEVMKRDPKYPAPIGHIENMGQECKLSINDRNLVDLTYAKECNLPKPVKRHTKDFKIPGTDCSFKLHPTDMMDEMAEEKEVMG